MKELCVTCKKETTYYREDHIDQRIGYIRGSGQLCLDCYDELYIKSKVRSKIMNKLLKVMDDIVITILGKSVVEKRSGEDRRKKKPRKRKYEKRIAGKSSDRRK